MHLNRFETESIRLYTRDLESLPDVVISLWAEGKMGADSLLGVRRFRLHNKVAHIGSGEPRLTLEQAHVAPAPKLQPAPPRTTRPIQSYAPGCAPSPQCTFCLR